MRLTTVGVLAMLALGCGDSSGPTLQNADFLGVWEVEVPATAGCWTAFALRFTVDPDDNVSDPANQLINVVSQWYLTSDPTVREGFSGNFNWGGNSFAFVFHLGGSTSLRMEGSGVKANQVSGIFRDRDGVAFPAGCATAATATHLSG